MPKKKHKIASKKRKPEKKKLGHPIREFIKSEIVSIKEKEEAIEEEIEEKLKGFSKLFYKKNKKYSKNKKLEIKNPFKSLFRTIIEGTYFLFFSMTSIS